MNEFPEADRIETVKAKKCPICDESYIQMATKWCKDCDSDLKHEAMDNASIS